MRKKGFGWLIGILCLAAVIALIVLLGGGTQDFHEKYEGVDLTALQAALDGRFYGLQLRDETVPPLELWTRCGENTLEGMSLQTLRQTLDRCENPRQRRLLELAARRIVEVCEGREASAL